MDDRSEIEAAARLYLDGLHEGDTEKLAAAFHPTSSLTWEENGELAAISRAEWLGRLKMRRSAKARGLDRQDEILLVDQSSPSTGFVKLKCVIAPSSYVDYLCFLKIGGRWRIVQKVFAIKGL